MMKRIFNFTLNYHINHKLKKGFTLIELLVIMAMIGVLASATITFINPLGQFQKQRDLQRKNDLAQIQRSLETYYNDNGKYPASSTAGPGAKINDTINCGASGCSWGGTWSPYMTKLPQDPSSGRTYAYFASPDGQIYRIYASLERGKNDSQACVDSGGLEIACPNADASVTTTGCNTGNKCNYGVSSPNTSP